jgi:hypothetical protein
MAIPTPPTHCKAGTGQCELPTITASQLSAAGILFAYIITRVYSVAATSEGNPVAVQITTASAGTIIYIFLCFWLVEDQLIAVLRQLRRAYAWAEFCFRVILLASLALLPNFVSTWIPRMMPRSVDKHVSGADYIVVFLAILFLMFIIWDGLVYFGAPREDEKAQANVRNIAKAYFRTDVVGLAILIVAEVLRFVNANAAAFVLIAFILFAAWLILAMYRELTGKRFASGLGRAMLR